MQETLMNIQMFVYIGLIYIVKIMKLFISIVLVLSMFLIGHKNIKTNISTA